MSFDALANALDAADKPVDFFLRDDDAGWDDPRLFALLDRTERAAVPIDLALIPQAVTPTLATSLCARKTALPRLLGLHQHGFAHVNHEAEGRRCEFGAARSVDAQLDDLIAGRERLQELFSDRLDPFFTPPWNRCSQATPVLLAELGFAALSRSRGATPLQGQLAELPVDVDWCKHTRAGGDGTPRIAAELAQRVAAGGPVGLMLHHAAMNDADLDLLDSVFALTTRHARARWRPMRELLVATR